MFGTWVDCGQQAGLCWGGRSGAGSGKWCCTLPGNIVRKGRVAAGMHDIEIKHTLRNFLWKISLKVSIIIRCLMGTNVGRRGFVQDALSWWTMAPLPGKSILSRVLVVLGGEGSGSQVPSAPGGMAGELSLNDCQYLSEPKKQKHACFLPLRTCLVSNLDYTVGLTLPTLWWTGPLMRVVPVGSRASGLVS